MKQPMELEAQLTYATALMAGCIYILYELVTFSKETGWEGLFQLTVVLFAMTGLELVIGGMALHIYFRGHWMALAMVANWKDRRQEAMAAAEHFVEDIGSSAEDQGEGAAAQSESSQQGSARSAWRRWLYDALHTEIGKSCRDDRRSLSEIVALDLSAVAVFYKTFHYLRAYLAIIVLMMCMYGAIEASGWLAWFCCATFVVLVSVTVLRMLGRLLFFIPQVATAAERWQQLCERVMRVFGLWTLPPEFHRRRVDRFHRIIVAAAMVALTVINMMIVTAPSLTSDKAVYIKGEDSRVVLRFRHGGVKTNYYVDRVFETRLSTRERDRAQPKWHAAGGNTYVCLVKLADLRPGTCTVSLSFAGYTRRDTSGASATIMRTEAQFLVVE